MNEFRLSRKQSNLHDRISILLPIEIIGLFEKLSIICILTSLLRDEKVEEGWEESQINDDERRILL